VTSASTCVAVLSPYSNVVRFIKLGKLFNAVSRSRPRAREFVESFVAEELVAV
jgi:hypothetical protein